MSSLRLRELTVPTHLNQVPAVPPIAQLRLRLATPMLGGGATPGGADPEHPFREASIRGHLRWWWRATVGVTCADLNEMRRREALLWGGEYRDEGGSRQHAHGKVKVAVDSVENVTQFGLMQGVPSHATSRDRNHWLRQALRTYGIPSYALGPMHTTDTMEEQSLVKSEASFTLSLLPNREIASDEQLEVEVALWAWLRFGGIGSRTRRGFGILTREDGLLPQPDWTPGTARIKSFTRLFQAVRFTRPNAHDKPHEAWNEALEIYRNFRKAEAPGASRPISNDRISFGDLTHSPWPEADSLRLTDPTGGGPLRERFTTPAFPRAQLGLPLAMSCMARQTGAFTPSPQTLVGSDPDRSRLASFVLTRAALAEGKWRAEIVLLRQPVLSLDEVAIEISGDDPVPLPPGSTLSAKRSPTQLIEQVSRDAYREIPIPYGLGDDMCLVFAGYLRAAKWTMETLP